MSDKPSGKEENEEVDLGQLFNAIGRLFEKLFAFTKQLLVGAFEIVIYALKPLVNNFKIVATALMLAAVIGYIVEKSSKPVYFSDMLVKPYFDSKYQLANNVDYFNALIGSKNTQELSRIFEIDSLDAKELISFEIEIGPETPNDLLVEYDTYLKKIDSSLAGDVTYESYIGNRDILSGSIFSVSAKSYKSDIFTSLEKGFEKTFKNRYSERLKVFRDKSINMRQKTYQEELVRIDSLQKMYIDVLKTDSREGNLSFSGESMVPLVKEKSVTREYDLFKEELRIRDSLRVLDEELILESQYYDILSGFEEVGRVKKDIFIRYSIVFPTIIFIIMVSVFLFIKAFKFIKEYE
ncbi:hypothetical protein [Winogradskyella sp.]|uniref:hypothetical protein n=1 Tax=Winogradskyella sp. TaxID=1883156 RepID=UPI00261CB81C|nr:hypothetical protein [Winogradskyella sp.]